MSRRVKELELTVSSLMRENLLLHRELGVKGIDLYEGYHGDDWPSIRNSCKARHDLKQHRIITRRLRTARVKYFFTRDKKHFNNIV